jgi:dTDP-4-dehydrorhamnose 3,5-epimerase-like enzyme
MVNSYNVFNDDRGSLIPIELKNVPFEVKRTFIVNNVPLNEIRGNHSHYNTKQYLICINGSVDVILNDGFNETTYKLIKGESILIPELVWDSQRFTSVNSEILVFCSTEYDINDYILDFNKFKELKINEKLV